MKEHFNDNDTYSLPQSIWNTLISAIKGARKRFITKKVISNTMSLKRAIMIVNEYIDYREGMISTIPFSKNDITLAIERVLMEVE